MQVFAWRERLTRADHQTQRQFRFTVPEQCARLTLKVRYEPKFLSRADSGALTSAAVAAQTRELSATVGEAMAERWATAFRTAELIVPNLLTISLDDADGAYRGAAHRHNPDQVLSIGTDAASPGLVAGPLPPGEWVVTLTAHTIVSPQCDVEIQIGAETASS